MLNGIISKKDNKKMLKKNKEGEEDIKRTETQNCRTVLYILVFLLSSKPSIIIKINE